MRIISIILIVFGLLLFTVGYLFKIMHWVNLSKGLYSGPIVLIIGIALLAYSIVKKKSSNKENDSLDSNFIKEIRMFKKGIVATILIYSLVQIIAFLLTDFITNLEILHFNIDNTIWDLSTLLLYPFQIIGFIMLGFHLNKKYGEILNYWKFLIVGILISFIASTSYYGCKYVVNEMTRKYLHGNGFNEFYVFTLSALIIMIIECAIVAIFYKKLKKANI